MKQGNGNGSGALALHVAPELVEAIADAVVARLAQQDTPRQSPWLTVDEASENLKCSRQAIYDRVRKVRSSPHAMADDSSSTVSTTLMPT